MSDYYHHFLSSMAGVGGHPNADQLDGSQSIPPPPVIPMGGPQLSNPYQSLGYFTSFPDPVMFNAPKSQRSRRKSAPGLDHIKHRRTRSGCYTCRSRRVKCDENHPICERCRKGKRECIYPEPPPPKGSGSVGSRDSAGPSQQTSPSSSHGDDDDDGDDQDSKLDPIMDEDEDEPESATSQSSAHNFPLLRRSSTTSSFGLQRVGSGHRHGSETPSFDANKGSSSPSASTSVVGSLTPALLHLSDTALPSPGLRPDWSLLPHELQFYLGYFCETITNYHYCIVSDADDFFRTILLGMAIRNEALLYAVVGFSAYHHALAKPNGRMDEFLLYYNRSVTLLLTFLKRKEKHSVATLLTVLQLATIEEYLGDWVNLMGHQKAAFEILTQLFTPQSIMQTSMGRMVLKWYARFDVFIGIMGSFETTLPREWFSASIEYYDGMAAAETENVGWKIDACASRLRLISMEMSLLFGKGAKQDVSEDEYVAEHQRLSVALDNWKENWDPALKDPDFLVTEFTSNRTPDPNDIVSPFTPAVLFGPPLFASTILTCEWHSIALMLGSQTASEMSESSRASMMEHAYAICQICEAVEFWPLSPAGSLIILHPCVAIAALFVKRDARHHMWIRKKLALLEVMGYISPATMRARMAELFLDESCIRWWLPNDEGFSPILQNIRAFADERNAMAVSAQSENLRQIRHVFSRMRLGQGAGIPEGGGGGNNDDEAA